MISFTQGLVLFTGVFTIVYTLILIFSERTDFKFEYKSSTYWLKYSIIFVMVLTLVLFVCVFIIFDFKDSLLYSLLFPFTVLLMLYMLRSIDVRTSMWTKKVMLFLVILLHVIIVYNPCYGISIDERHPALARMAIEGFYDTNRPLLNPVYNPLPMDLSLFLVLFYVPGFSPIHGITQWLVSFFMILTIDLILYSLVIKLTEEWISGILAILILAITPPLNFLEHYCKLAGMMLVLISIFIVIKIFKDRTLLIAILTLVASYIAAIFYHPTAGLELFALFGILLGSLFLKSFNDEAKAVLKNPLFRALLVYLSIITLARWIYGGGFELLVCSMKNYIVSMFQWKEEEKLVPLYERAGVNPIQSFAWSTPAAMAGSLILYTLLKKEIWYSVLIPSLAMGGAFFLSIGLVGAYTRSGGFYASMYPGFILLMPAAALVTFKALRSPLKLIALSLILLVTISASVAIKDPMLMRVYIFQKEPGVIIGGGYFPVKEKELTIARSLLLFAPADKIIKTSFGPAFLYINPYGNIEAFVGFPGDPKYERDYRLLLQGRIKYNTIYVINVIQLPKTLLYTEINGISINLIYNANQYITFIRSG